MKGVVFSELLDWIERGHGVEALDEVLLDAELAHGGAYTSAGTYDWQELVAIVDALSARVGCGRAETLRGYGRHLFGAFAAAFAGFVGNAESPVELLARAGALIEQEVAKLQVEAPLPRLTVRATADGCVVDYRSWRPFADLAHGMIEGCFAHYGVRADVQESTEGDRHRFTVTVVEEAACPVSR